MPTRDDLLADLLMAAAYADRRLEGREVGAVKAALKRATGLSVLPPTLMERIDSFRPDGFDVEHAVSHLGLTDAGAKRQLLELIATVHEADDVTDLEEDAYLRTVAEALGMAPSEYADLVIEELAVESIRGAWNALQKGKPPPLPPES